MHKSNITILKDSHPQDSFQQLLLSFSTAAAEDPDLRSLIRLFCKNTREFFQVSGVYFWELVSPDVLVGTEADGLMAERFLNTRLDLNMAHSAVAIDAIRSRSAVYRNNVDPAVYPMAAQYGTRSVMGAPLIVFGEVMGAIVFTHESDPGFFNDDLAAKATILAGQIGSLLEAKRVNQASREEHRRAEILVEAAQALPAMSEVSTAVQVLADRVQAVLRAPLVCVLLRQRNEFEVCAVSAETPSLRASAQVRFAGPVLAHAAKAAGQALAAGEPVTVAGSGEASAMPGVVEAGKLLAAPFLTSCTHGAILVYPHDGPDFTAEERSLVATLAGFGGVAIANAELYATATEHAQELHQLLEIASELTSVGNFDGFMQRFVEHAVGFLGFRRCFLALLENNVFQVRWGALEGKSHPIDAPFPTGVASEALLRKEPFWTDDASQVVGGNLEAITKWEIKQLLAVPLLGCDGQVLGMFGVLDQKDGTPISPENVRRAKTLAAEVSIALEMTRNLHLSEQHRRRAEALMSLALETSSLLGAEEFARRFVSRAANLMNARAAALLLKQETGLEVVALHGLSGEASVGRRLKAAVTELLTRSALPVISGLAGALLGPPLASLLGLKDLVVVLLRASDGDVVGVLCLGNRENGLSEQDKQLLQAIAGQGAAALEKARLFARMDQANRHWIEIFDAISDFIVVHDENHHVLRVNRPLADFIGVKPGELIGISMSALLAMATDTSPRACPFCRNGVEGPDEFVQPVLERTYLVSTSRIHARESESWQTIHVLKDITDRREAERRYRELFDNIQEGLFFTTPQGRFVEVNDALVRMLGYDSREELLQSEVPTQIYLSEERRKELVRLMEERGSLRNYHVTLRRKDGSPIHVLMNAFAARDGEGGVTQFRGLMLDITDLKNFQAELQRERDFSSKILNNTQSLILVADTAGLITYANRRWYEAGGYEHPQLVGRPLMGLIAAARRQAMQDALQATLAGQHVDNLELPVMRADGRTGQFSVNLSPMRDEQGHVSSIVVVMTDITDAAMLQAKLMHTEKMAAVGQLVSGVAHEVNNPLTAILGFADLLMENPDIPDSAKKDLRVILQEAQRTKQIVQNLLSFARQMPPQRRPVQVNGILTRTIQLRAYDFSSHGVEVIEHFHGDMPEVVGDPHQLQQVFLNILNNAYDAVRETSRPPRIEIRTSPAGGFAEVAFCDNGPGIVHPDRIFDPFFTTKEVGKGTGLGLSICYGIVREHGGEIFCHNNDNGPGATFVVRLPAVSVVASMSASAGTVQR